MENTKTLILAAFFITLNAYSALAGTPEDSVKVRSKVTGKDAAVIASEKIAGILELKPENKLKLQDFSLKAVEKGEVLRKEVAVSSEEIYKDVKTTSKEVYKDLSSTSKEVYQDVSSTSKELCKDLSSTSKDLYKEMKDFVVVLEQSDLVKKIEGEFKAK